MKPIKLTLKNLRSLKDFEYNYEPGITGIMGPIYAGKSNFATIGQQFAWTGTVPSGLTKSDLLNWYAEEGSTEVIFKEGNATYTLKRNIHNSKVTLENDYDSYVTTDKTDIEDTLESIFGLPLKLFAEYCFIPQLQMTNIITNTRSSRLDYMLKMAGVEKANKCRTIIQDYVSKIPSYVDKSLAIKTAEQEIENISAEIDKIKKDLKEYVDIDKEYTDKSRELDNLKLKITEEDKTLKISELSNKIKGIESGISELTGGVGEIEEVDAPADSDHAIVNWYKVYSDKYNQNKSELKKLGETIEEVEDNPEELYEELTTLKNKHVELKDKISLIKQGKCPTCTRPFDNAEQEVDNINNQITEIKVAFENKKIEYTELKNKAEEITKTNSRRTILLNEIKTAENSRPEELDSTSYDEAVARIESYRKYSDKIKEAQKVEKEKLKLVEEKSSLVERLNQVKNLETVSEDSISKVEAELQNLKEKKDEFDSKSKTLISLETQVSEKHKQVAEYKEDQKKGNANREIINFLDKAKTVLHRDNLPMLVLEDRRRTLNAVMNKMMKYVDAGYSPRLTKEFDFVIDFRNGPSDRPIKDLSGGQLVLLSSLFHLVKLELLGSIPFLVLDEPTMYLNTSDLSDMASMFKSYLENKGKEGTYIMIPTHEDELKPCFTNIFTFSEHAV